MDEYASSSFQNPNPISKKRRSITTRKRRSRPTPHSPPDQTAFRKKEFLLNAHPPSPPPIDAADEVRSKRSTGGSQSALYRRGQTHTAIAIRENKVTKLKVKVGGVSRTIHQHKEENLHIAEPTRKSVRVNKRRVLDEEGPPPPSPRYEKPVADTKAKKKRLSKDIPSDGSTDYKTGEEEEAAVVIAADVPHMEGAKMKNLTSRQRAMLTGGKDSGTVEFPEGLPPAPSRKLKSKESEEEKQAKKAEAAQRRRLQVEKAARESQEEAIRKILGLDSDRKKEEKKLKEKEEKV